MEMTRDELNKMKKCESSDDSDSEDEDDSDSDDEDEDDSDSDDEPEHEHDKRIEESELDRKAQQLIDLIVKKNE